jgi:hypothetical protein
MGIEPASKAVGSARYQRDTRRAATAFSAVRSMFLRIERASLQSYKRIVSAVSELKEAGLTWETEVCRACALRSWSPTDLNRFSLRSRERLWTTRERRRLWCSVICYGAWPLLSAGLVKGRYLTSYFIV